MAIIGGIPHFQTYPYSWPYPSPNGHGELWLGHHFWSWILSHNYNTWGHDEYGHVFMFLCVLKRNPYSSMLYLFKQLFSFFQNRFTVLTYIPHVQETFVKSIIYHESLYNSNINIVAYDWSSNNLDVYYIIIIHVKIIWINCWLIMLIILIYIVYNHSWMGNYLLWSIVIIDIWRYIKDNYRSTLKILWIINNTSQFIIIMNCNHNTKNINNTNNSNNTNNTNNVLTNIIMIY